MTLKDNNDGTFNIVAPCSFDKPKPLTDDEILHIYSECYRNTLMGIDPLEFAKAIEKAHGIQNSVE